MMNDDDGDKFDDIDCGYDDDVVGDVYDMKWVMSVVGLMMLKKMVENDETYDS